MPADGKPRWGRDAAAVADIAAGRRSAGARSVLLGLGALLLLAIPLVVFAGLDGGEVSGAWATTRLLVAFAAYLVAAPVALAMGLVAGFRGLLGNGGGRGAAVAGLLLNLILLGLAVTIALIALAGAGRVA